MLTVYPQNKALGPAFWKCQEQDSNSLNRNCVALKKNEALEGGGGVPECPPFLHSRLNSEVTCVQPIF